MNKTERVKTMNALQEMGKQVEMVEKLLSAREELGAVRLLIKARRLGEQVCSNLITGCLRRLLADAQSDDPNRRESCLEELSKLLSFIQSISRSSCRQQIGENLREK